jgi:hypothetical protein
MEPLPLDRALVSVLAARLDGASRPELLALITERAGAEVLGLPRLVSARHETPSAGRSYTAINCSDHRTSRRSA